MPKLTLLILLLALPSTAALARDCGAGGVSGGFSAAGDALQNYDCGVLARIYCRLGENRDGGMPEAQATRETSDWLEALGRTGSHVKGNWDPLVALAAAEVFRAKHRRPGALYYRAAYACGVSKRIGDDTAAQQRAGKAFDAAADRCEREHPQPGRSFPNQPLRECMAAALERVTAQPQAP